MDPNQIPQQEMGEVVKDDSRSNRVFTIIGIVLCAILVPILIINCIFLIKGFVNKNEVPSVGGIFPMIVLSDSMVPMFYEGDLIICKTIKPEEIQKNDVISYFDPEGDGSSIVTHRVLEIYNENGKLSFQTKGDANNTQDNLPIPAENVVGVYTDIHIPNAGNVAMFMQRTEGLIVCVFLPLLALVGYDIIRRKLYEKKHSDDKDDLLRELEELRKLKELQLEALKQSQEQAETQAPPPEVTDTPEDPPHE